MRVSVIIPCFNEAKTIGNQLAALAHQRVDFDWEVIVVDNGSTDGTVTQAERFRDLLPQLRIIQATDRRGAAHARNVGAEAARGRWLAFCDADDAVSGTWLQSVATDLETHPVVASRFDGRWLNPGRNGRPLGQRHDIERLWYPPFLKHAGGSGLCVWKSHHQAIGGFDERLRILEDADYSIRLQLEGLDIHFSRRAVLHVRYPTDRSGLFRQARLWARANTAIYRRYGLGGQAVAEAWRGYAEGVWRAVRKLRKLRNPRVRSAVVWQIGWHLGLLEGALIHRVAPVPHHATHR